MAAGNHRNSHPTYIAEVNTCSFSIFTFVAYIQSITGLYSFKTLPLIKGKKNLIAPTIRPPYKQLINNLSFLLLINKAFPFLQDPVHIYIDRKKIFEAAAQRLHLSVTREITLEIQPNDFVGKITIFGIDSAETSEGCAKEFYGEFKNNANEAIQSAYDEAIKFLVNEGIAIIDDFSYPDLQTTKSKLLLTETYLMFSEDNENTVESELNFKIEGYKKLEEALNEVYIENSNILPLRVTHYKGQWDNEEKKKLFYTGHPFPTDLLSKLAFSCSEMHKMISLPGQVLIKGKHKEYRIRKKEVEASIDT